MFIYFTIFIVVGAIGFIEVFGNLYTQKYYKVYFQIFFTLFFIWFIGFRECGYDYENYEYYFHLLHSDFWNSNAQFLMVEKFYAWLNYILPSYRILLIVFATITCTATSYFFYKNTQYPFYSYFLLLGISVYLNYMGQYRQGISIPIILLAFVSTKKIHQILLIIIASSFHISALLAFLIFILPQYIFSIKRYIQFLLLALISNLTLSSIFKIYLEKLPSFIHQKLSYYTNSEEGLTYGLNLAMLLRVLSFLIFYKYKNIIQENRNGPFLFNIYFLSLLIYLGLGFLPQLSGRGSLYFYITEIVISSYIIGSYELSLRKRLLIFSYYYLIATYRQISFFTGEAHDSYIPYKNILYHIF